MFSHTPNPTDDELRQTFRAAREAKGWTQGDLADLLEVHWITVSKLERGVIALSRNWIERLSAALGLSVEISVSEQPVGAAIKLARKARSLAQADVAGQIGVTVQAVSQWERGENYPSAVNLLKLSGILGVDLGTSDLVALTKAPPAGAAASPVIAEAMQEVISLLHALDGLGARIAGEDGAAVSAVALAGKSTAEVALQALLAGEAR